MQGLFSTSTLLFGIFVGLGALNVVDNTLSKTHPPGGVSADATSIASYSSLTSRQAAVDAVHSWQEWYTLPGAGGLALWAVLLIYLVIDIALIAIPLFLLLRRLSGYAERRVEEHPGGSEPEKDSLTQLIGMARKAIVAYLLADVAEDVLLVLAGCTGWPIVVGAVGVASILKWLSLGAAIGGLAIGLIGTSAMRSVVKQKRVQQAALRRLTARQPVDRQSGQPIASRIWGQVLALRVHVCLAAILLGLAVLPGDLGRQLDDAFLLLYDRGGVLLWATLLLAALLVFTMFQTAKLCLHAYRKPPKQTATSCWINAEFIAAGALLALVGGVATKQESFFGSAVIMPGVILVLVGVLSCFAPRRPTPIFDVPSDDTSRGLRLAVTLAATPVVVLVALSVRNGVRLWTIHDYLGAAIFLGAAVIAVPALTGVMVFATGNDRVHAQARPRDGSSRWVPLAFAIASVCLFVGVAVGAQYIGDRLGPWAVVLLFVITLLLGLTALVLVGDRMPPYGVLAACGLRRTPFVAAAIICFIGTSAIDTKFEYHSARLLDVPGAAQEMPLSAALTEWAQQQTSGDRKEIPLVFVASSGGGIRAAYWTSLVLGCVVRQDGVDYESPNPDADLATCLAAEMPKNAMFLASGISGGSLGLTLMHAIQNRNEWSRALREDFLGPAIAGLAFRDVPNSLLRLNIHDQDRAAVLEGAWEEAVSGKGKLDRGFLNAAFDGDSPVFPMLALHGTSVTDGCRVTVSALDVARPLQKDGAGAEPAVDCLALDESRFRDPNAGLPTLAGTKDAFNHTCQGGDDRSAHDIRLSTAALLSARFPYVSPTGTLYSCDGGDRTFDLDGGLVDSSGASPLALSWPEVLRWLNEQHGVCYSPKLILIENGYLPQTRSKPAARPAELAAPLTGLTSVRNATTPTARQAAALAFQKSFASTGCNERLGTAATEKPWWRVPNVVDFYPVSQPGIEAPLGWTLSSFSQRSLEEQLGSDLNRCAAETVAAWFEPIAAEPDHCAKLDEST